MPAFGLLGKTLTHSFSPAYFQEKFKMLKRDDCSYQKIELPTIEEVAAILNAKSFAGFNVTVPYKEQILPYLQALSEEASVIGAVNCIALKEGRYIGFNTDAYGFAQSIKPFLDYRHERALILGHGGAAKAVAYALKKIGVEVAFVTRSKTGGEEVQFRYEELNEHIMRAFLLIVNCTPIGTFPHVNEAPALPYHLLSDQHFVYDLVYNPAETKLLQLAKEKGCMVQNGYSMLQLQAERSWEIWQEK